MNSIHLVRILDQPRQGVWLRGLAWTGAVLLDATIVVIGIYQYYLQPLPQPYPFVWVFDFLGWPPSVEALGVMTFLSIGLTPAAALLLLFTSLARLVLSEGPHPLFRLAAGAFCLMVGLGFLTTLGVYVLRAPQVLQWDREVLAVAVHLLIAGRGLRLLDEASPRCNPADVKVVLALSLIWIAAVAIPQHDWLVVWGHTLRDWLGS